MHDGRGLDADLARSETHIRARRAEKPSGSGDAREVHVHGAPGEEHNLTARRHERGRPACRSVLDDLRRAFTRPPREKRRSSTTLPGHE